MSEARQLALPMAVDPLRRCEERLVELVDAEFGAPSTLVRQFIAWHHRHPRVYALVERFVAELRARGRRRFGIALIWERLRYELSLERDADPVLNNNYRPYIARLFELHHPELGEVFRKRSIGPGRERHIA